MGAGPGTHDRGDGGCPLLQLFQVQRLLGAALVLVSLVGVRRLGRGDRAWWQGTAGGMETSVRSMGSQPLLAPAWMMWLGVPPEKESECQRRETWGQGGGSSLPPLLHSGPEDKTPPTPAQRIKQLLRWPRTRESQESPHSGPVPRLALGKLLGNPRINVIKAGEA